MLQRMIRAAKLDSSLYEEVEHDNSLTGQAATVVAIVAVLGGIGAALGVAQSPEAGGGSAIGVLIGTIVSALLGWVAWSYITYWVGTTFFGGTATPGEMLRTLGFAQTPRLLGIFAFIPGVGGLIAFLGGVLSLVAGIVAIRQALDFSTGKAVMTAIIGWIVSFLITLVFGLIFGGLGLLTGLFR